MSLEVTPLLNQVEIKFDSFEKYLELEANKKRGGKKGPEITEELKRTMKRLARLRRVDKVENANRFIAMVLGAMTLMKVAHNELFVIFEVS